MSHSNKESLSVQVNGLRKAYGVHPVLKGISFHVDPGEIFVIMGPSGSGKSVLLRHIIGLEPPDQGEILLEGESVDAPGVMDKYRLALVFQSGALLSSLTVSQNVGLYLTEHRLKSPEEIARITNEKLELIGLRGIGERFPTELSGGMRKRVAIARALVIDPQLILYDEPTSELDPISAVTIGEEIWNLNQRTHSTSIVVTHDRDLAFGIASRIAVMKDGSLLAVGSPAEIKNHTDPDIHEFLHADFKAVNHQQSS